MTLRSWTTTEGKMEMAQVRVPSDRSPTPPGEMLLEEFIKPLGMTQGELADRIRVSYVRVNEIVNGRRGITPSTALRLAKALGTTPQFWLNGQLALDLYQASHDEDELQELERIQPVAR
jgi:addiction module HigA family antidote